MIRARYTAEMVGRTIIAIVDLGTGKSVTNDAERVVRDLAERGFPVRVARIVYRDSDGIWDGIRTKDGEFAGFVPLGDAGRDQAIRHAEIMLRW